MSNSSQVRAVLFDLDGTLADTSADMTDALNRLLMTYGKDVLAYDVVRKHASKGSIAMLKLGFGEHLEEKRGLQLRDEFLQLYAEMLCNKTKLFTDVPKLLDFLDQTGIPWGIVTNKPGRLAEPLIQQLGIAFRAICMISGDSLSKKKPSPNQLLHAANIIGVDKTDCIYMGDDLRDVQAGKAAKMKTAIAAYGYIQDHRDIHNWGADVVFNKAIELKNWLLTHNQLTMTA